MSFSSPAVIHIPLINLPLTNSLTCVCRGWLERESRHGLQPGDYWFLIAVLWWQQWRDYVKYVSKAF
jgi:hypothetical protein